MVTLSPPLQGDFARRSIMRLATDMAYDPRDFALSVSPFDSKEGSTY